MAEDAPPRELVIDAKPAPGDSNDGAGTAMAPFAIPVAVGGLLAKFVSPTMGLVGLVGSIAVVIALRKPREGRFVLRVVDDAVLEIARERGTGPAVRVPLDDLLDVTLDKHTSAGGRGGSSMERVRLALQRRASDEPIFVPDERITPIEAQEWHSKVRVFLRKHTWLPDDER